MKTRVNDSFSKKTNTYPQFALATHCDSTITAHTSNKRTTSHTDIVDVGYTYFANF